MNKSYETTAHLRKFSGLMQTGDGRNLDLQYAVDSKNCDTSGGTLKPMKKGSVRTSALAYKLGFVAVLYRRYPESSLPVFVAAAGTSLYTSTDYGATWVQRYTGFTSRTFDYVTYETTIAGDAVDIMLLSSKSAGMFCLYGNDLHIAPVTTPYMFGTLALYADRVWGSGIKTNPDLLVYSAPHNPFDWAANPTIPEDGGGEIRQPSWDGDSFVALKPYGDRLLALKKNSVWVIIGTSPDNYTLIKQFGGGTYEENTAVVHGDYAYMLSDEGVIRYNGSSVEPFAHDTIADVINRIYAPTSFLACAVMWGSKYFLAVPLKPKGWDEPGSTYEDPGTIFNNAIIVYDTEYKTFNVIEGVNVLTFFLYDNGLFYTDADTAGQMWEMKYGDSLPVEWISGYQNFGQKNAIKSNFIVYITVHVDEIPGDPYPVQGFDMTLTITTENKTKAKTFRVLPGDKMKRLNIGNAGRWAQIKLSTNTTLDWEVLGGLQVEMELDQD